MSSSLLTEAELMQWLNCKRRGDLERYLRKQGIPVLYGVDGTIGTTLEAVNQALGVGGAQQQTIDKMVGFA